MFGSETRSFLGTGSWTGAMAMLTNGSIPAPSQRISFKKNQQIGAIIIPGQAHVLVLPEGEGVLGPWLPRLSLQGRFTTVFRLQQGHLINGMAVGSASDKKPHSQQPRNQPSQRQNDNGCLFEPRPAPHPLGVSHLPPRPCEASTMQ